MPSFKSISDSYLGATPLHKSLSIGILNNRKINFAKIFGNLAKLLKGGFEVFNNFLGEDSRLRQVFRFLQAFVFEPEKEWGRW